MTVPSYWYLDPYPVPSHRYFRESYVRDSTYDWQVHELPAKAWRWRLRTAGAVLAEQLSDSIRAGDIVFTTSMLDVCQLKAILPAEIKVVQYFHENQLTYAREAQSSIENEVRLCHTVLAADQIIFNSLYHRDLLSLTLEKAQKGWNSTSKLPRAIEKIKAAPVVYPGVAVPQYQKPKQQPPLLLWNHRWCEEKNPELLSDLLDELDAGDLNFRLAVVGSPNEKPSAVFKHIYQRHQQRLVAWGFVPDDQYRDLLQETSVVLSTSNEENFGLAMMEAVGHGALPVMPDNLVYPEIYASAPPTLMYADAQDARKKLSNALLLATEYSENDQAKYTVWVKSNYSVQKCALELDSHIPANACLNTRSPLI